MSKIMAGVASLGLLVGASAGAAAAPATRVEPTFKGEVVSVDTVNHSFVVKGTEKGEASEMSFAVAEGTTITIEGQRVLFGQLRKGEPVTVVYRMVDGTGVATSVHHHKKKAV